MSIIILMRLAIDQSIVQSEQMNERITLTGPWVADFGYGQVTGAFVRSDDAAVGVHPFAPELRSIFGPERGPGGDAVFCIDRVPTVCLLDQRRLSTDAHDRREEVRDFCERLWNQNLARVVLITDPEWLEVWSVDNPDAAPQRYALSEREDARRAWSVTGLLGGEALRGRDSWFDPHKRVDKILLDNILVLVEKLSLCGLDPAAARRLVARLIFITYLEDREIVGETYRSRRGVRPLFDLVRERNRTGLRQLINKLRSDFNGDFLTTADSELGWENLSDAAFGWIEQFLGRTTLRTGQASFWRYDFSQIPIELIASIYETFLASKDEGANEEGENQTKRKQGAYYTPRLLADWVVELATADRDILREKIFDGACGSGMLLTAAFRRLVRAFEARNAVEGRVTEADFATRRKLLLDHIFGGDIDEDACQLTAFSLYLALLSDLTPRDLVELRNGGEKLPTLANNIRRGTEGDFFGTASEAANRERFTLFLSNPPWREMRRDEASAVAVENWRSRQEGPIPHIPKRQIATAFALGAADTLSAGGRVALILPVTPFVSGDATQRDFRAHLLGRYRIDKIVNFSDMRRLIFADAVHPFVVLIATARDRRSRFSSIERESFEYWTPKTDISLAFGRLAVHGGDRADLPSTALLGDEAQLAVRYWGTNPDIALLQRLKRRGSIKDLTRAGWLDAKGFHAQDNDRRRPADKRDTDVPDWMSEAGFLPATALPKDVPFVPAAVLRKFPYERIARVPDERLFRGPRVLWTDGAHPEDGVKAAYAEAPFSYQHSLAVLSAPDTDDGRLTARFLTVYLRSPMGVWLLLLLSSSVASERPKLHVREAMDWPFWSLERHPAQERARAIMTEVDELLASVENAHELMQAYQWTEVRTRANSLVYAYFQLTPNEIAMIEELSTFAGAALQPASLSHRALLKPLRRAPSMGLMQNYASALSETLTAWRDTTGGVGDIHVATWTGRSVPMGAAVLSLGTKPPPDRFDDDSILEVLAKALERVTAYSPDSLLTIPDVAIVDGPIVFLIKPLVSRFWMRRCAIEDANQLALQLQGLTKRQVRA
ncbi:N-6 DNA methylase [Pararhizobium sp. YC-54]|uniref:N-6 DNA methylase n=1 Tax=Pararhizobium sp. YC-54 TaxID=2986920 RepID=UPI0021F779C7|nr:N-6 DNA methylase [Pararhizobium sp. YC-54]MCV9999446.1 N-6 DNA methylase [Pararhizobium sp. YC-54]